MVDISLVFMGSIIQHNRTLKLGGTILYCNQDKDILFHDISTEKSDDLADSTG